MSYRACKERYIAPAPLSTRGSSKMASEGRKRVRNVRYEGRCNPIHAQGKPMTYNRMEAKSMAGEHCRFCGDARSCWSKRRVASSGYVAIPLLWPFEAGGAVNISTNALRCAILTPLMVTRVLGKPVRNAASSGHRKSTKRMRNIRSMCPGMEWWEGNEVQISGNKIEPQWPFLDTLVVVKPCKLRRRQWARCLTR